MYEVSVKCVIKEPLSSRYVLMLETICGSYLIPINIGTFEAEAIYSQLNSISTPRPMTYDFISSILSNMDGVNVDKVVVDSEKSGVYTAKMYINQDNGGQKIVDCRPSDAVALSMKLCIPIYVEEKVLSGKCISRDGIDRRDESTLNHILNDQGNTFWNV